MRDAFVNLKNFDEYLERFEEFVGLLLELRRTVDGGVLFGGDSGEMGYCEWALTNERLREYHDTEWGIPVHDDKKMFEHLMMEVMQCGLSWDIVLKKREIFRTCFDGFDYDKVAEYGEADVERIMNVEEMIRSKRKIEAVINNAKRYKAVREEFGSFCDFLWAFSDGKTILYNGHDYGKIPVSNGLSKKVAAELKRRGFKFVGDVTIYSHLQACGIINDHDGDCPCYKRIVNEFPTIRKRRYLERWGNVGKGI